MRFTPLLSLVFGLLSAPYALALSPDAEVGKTLYPACHVCHDPSMKPPLGPPMWGVQRRYLNATIDEEDFVQRMVQFVKAPSREKAVHDEALEQLGLMPPLPLPDEMLKSIARYILEERFPPPCDHWKIAVARANERGDVTHAAKDQSMLDRFCQSP